MSKKLLGIIFGLISLSFVGLTTTTIINYNNLDENYYTQEDVNSKINELEEYIKEKDGELQGALDTLREEYENKIANLQSKDEENATAIKTLTDTYIAKVKELEASDKSNADALSELKSSYETSLEELQSKDEENAEAIKTLTDTYTAKVKELESSDKANADALAELKSSYETSLEELQSKDEENAEAIQSLTDAYTAKVKELEASDKANADALAELKSSYEASLKELEAADEANAEAIKTLTDTYTAKVQELEASDKANAEALAELKSSYETSLEELEAADEANAEEIKSLTDTYTAKVKELEASDKANADALAELKSNYETSLEELQAKDDVLDQLIADLDGELQTKIAEITLKYDGKVTEIENIIDSLKAVDTEQNEKIDTLITQVEALMNVPKYTISFDTDGAGSIDSQTIELGDKVLEPFAPSKDGYIFDGWFYGEEKWSFIGYPVSENMTLTAKWHVAYDIPEMVFENTTYIYDGIVKTLKVSNADELPSELFVMYSSNSRKEVGQTLAYAYVMDQNGYVYETVTAVLTIEKADLSFTMDGFTTTYDGNTYSLAINEELPYGVTVTYENNNQKNAGTYEVTAKFTVSDNYNAVSDIKANLVIAKATPTVNVTHTAENFTLNDELNLNVESSVAGSVALKGGQTLTIGTRNYTYVFTPLDTVNYNTVTGNVDITVYSKVTFLNFDDEILDVQYIEKAGYIDDFTPIYEGENGYLYTFVGWSFQNGYFESTTEVYTSITLKADYNRTPINYTISYNLNDGTTSETLVYSYTILDEVNIPELSKVGYEFNGWSGTGLDSLSTSFTLQNAFGDKEYTANFTPNSYKVTFDLVGGSCDANELAVNYDEDVTLPTPRLFGYDFDGWTLSGTPIENTFKWNYLSDINLVANWSQADIVEITTAEELASVAYSLDGNYILMENIDLSGISWDVLGDASTPFTGTFDGNGYTISNLSLSSITNYSGLFGANSGTIKNLNIVDANIDAGAIGASILVGNNSGIINNCSVSGIIEFNTQYTGGLCAYNTGTISNSTSSATVSNSKYVGGLVGYTYGGTIEASSSTGSVSNGLTESYMGGLIGYADASVNILKITDSSSTATINYEYLADSTVVTSYVGGLVGYATCGELTEINGYVKDCLYNADIIVNIDSSQTYRAINMTSCVGGLIGYSSYFKCEKNYSNGNINNMLLKDDFQNYDSHITDGYSDKSYNSRYYYFYNKLYSYVGGLIGIDYFGDYSNSFSNIVISNKAECINYYHSYSSADICTSYAYANSYVGGAIGKTTGGKIQQIYSSSLLSSDTNAKANYSSIDHLNQAHTESYVGMLVGYADVEDTNVTIIDSFGSTDSLSANAIVDSYPGYYSIINNYGGLCGNDENILVDNCYRYSGTDSNIELGTPTSLANLKSVNFITNTLGWDTEIWLLENGKYPTLK